jgi:hypothetical protein
MFGGGMRNAQIQLHSPRVNSCFPAADICNPQPEHIRLSEYATVLQYNADGGVQ